MRPESWFRFLFVIYCLEAGLFLVLAPWTDAWERIVLFLPVAVVRHLLSLSWMRGLVSGFGLIHLVWAAHDLDLILRPPTPGPWPVRDSAPAPPTRPALRFTPIPARIPRLWAVTDFARLGSAAWAGWCSRLRELGVDALHLREKALDDRALFELAVASRDAFAPPGVLVVNRRLDLALGAGADGVHLPADGLPVSFVRRGVPSGFLIGRSTHSVEEIRAAKGEGADYVFFGPVLSTPSKSDPLRAHGISSLDAAAAVGLPVIAIGGMDAETAPEAIAAGAWGVAAIRAFGSLERAARLATAVADAGGREERRMIVGIGLDLVDLERLSGLLDRHGDAFVRRVCREGEARVASGPARAAHLGGLFAAKEATMKALGTGWSAGVGFRQIEVVRAPGGAPSLRLHGEAERRARVLGVERSHLTISHDGRTAAAVVVLERGAEAAT